MPKRSASPSPSFREEKRQRIIFYSSSIESLPSEVLFLIFQKIACNSIYDLRWTMTCRRFLEIVSDTHFWTMIPHHVRKEIFNHMCNLFPQPQIFAALFYSIREDINLIESKKSFRLTIENGNVDVVRFLFENAPRLKKHMLRTVSGIQTFPSLITRTFHPSITEYLLQQYEKYIFQAGKGCLEITERMLAYSYMHRPATRPLIEFLCGDPSRMEKYWRLFTKETKKLLFGIICADKSDPVEVVKIIEQMERRTSKFTDYLECNSFRAEEAAKRSQNHRILDYFKKRMS